MRETREVRKAIRRIEKVKTWQLVILLILCSFVAATFLRLNNIGMVERRAAVYAADKAGDDDLLAQRLWDLQRYTAHHMNADTGRIALDNKYQRDSDKIKKELEQQSDSNPNGNIYKRAADVCDPRGRAEGWRWPDPRYTECIDKELRKYPSAGTLETKLKLPPTELYYHQFTGPLWSPDFAGFSVLLCLLIALVIVVRLIVLVSLKVMVKFRYRAL